ncbi:MAG: hypothetical protein RSB66_03345 [Clostridium sp.]
MNIGVISHRNNAKDSIYIKNFLKKRRNSVLIIEKYIQKNIYNNGNIFNYIIYDINLEDILNGMYKEIEFDIILMNTLDEDTYNKDAISQVICTIKPEGYFIFNSDFINDIDFTCNNIYPITYGLNERSTVTASSISDLDVLEFSYCLQRSIVNYKGEVVHPFEHPIRESGSSEDLFSYLASLTCMLVLGYNF